MKARRSRLGLAQAVAITPGPVLIRLMHQFGGGLHSDDIAGPETMPEAWGYFGDLMRASGAENAEFALHANAGDW